MNSKQQIGVSIFCAAYNHEKYIRDALEGFVMQKTSFPFEVLIHDDASTDGTAAIIREYEEKYPEIIKPIYQKENQYSQGIKITPTYQLPRARGKYVAFCEGDDRWTDPLKLQKQYEALEMQPNCVACMHYVQAIKADSGEPTQQIPPFNIPNRLDTVEYIRLMAEQKRTHYLQTSSYFVIKEKLQKYWGEEVGFRDTVGVGDAPLLLWLSVEGDFFIIPEFMSNYRQQVKGSWTARIYSLPEKKVQHQLSMYKMFFEFNKYTKYQYKTHVDNCLKKIRNEIYVSQGAYKLSLPEIKELGELTKDDKKEIRYKIRETKRYNRKIKCWKFFKKVFPWAVPLVRKLRAKKAKKAVNERK